MKNKIIVVFLGMLFSVVAGAQAQETLTVDKIVEKANLAAYYSGADGSAEVQMTITDAQGRSRKRAFKILRLDIEDGGAQKFFVYFRKPNDVQKMTYMVWKYTDKDDDRWLYLPALDLVRRIAAADKRTSFVGSHFVYEDVSGRGVEADVHELLEGTQTHYKIKNTPKETAGVNFAYYTIIINKETFISEKMEYFDDKGVLIRSIEVQEVAEVGGHPTVLKSVAKDIVRGGETLMEFSRVQYDIGITDNFYTERFLRRVPSKWIK